MNCYLGDVGQLGLAFYMQWSPRRAERSIGLLSETIQYYDRYLDQYPAVMVDCLEDVYGLARCLGAMDTNFLTAQLSELSWRGVISGGVYALLCPSAEYLDQLYSVPTPNYPENIWACECAIAEIEGRNWPPDCSELQRSLYILRDAVNRVGIPHTPLRRRPEPAEIELIDDFREYTRIAYRENPLETAQDLIRDRYEYQWLISYERWLREYAYKEDCQSLYIRR